MRTWWKIKRCTKCRTSKQRVYHQVRLDELVHGIQSLFPVRHGHAGLLVFLSPWYKLLFGDVFITQTQRPQSLVGKTLQNIWHQVNLDLSVLRWSYRQMCQLLYYWICRMQGIWDQTNFQSRFCGVSVQGGRTEALVDHRIGSFTIQPDSSVRKPHWTEKNHKSYSRALKQIWGRGTMA